MAEISGQKRGLIATKNYIVLLFVFLAYPLMAHAGGLGIAAILALSGLVGLIGFRPPALKDIPKRVPIAIWAIMVLLFWGLLSVLWSPYQSTDALNNAQKMMLGVPLYFGCAAIIHAQKHYRWNVFPWFYIVVTIIIIFTVIIDLLTNYSLTLWVDPLAEGEVLERRLGDMIQNVGHAVSVLALLVAPVSVILWQKGRLGKMSALLIILMIGYSTHISNASAAQVGLIMAIIFMAIASYKPKFALRAAFALAGTSLLFAPFLAFLSSELSVEMRAGLPFSWEERVANWETVYGKILEHPFIGHGFDAVRTFSGTHTIRGFEGRALVSLHPHNAGLHLWVELGFVGVVLACIAIYLGARSLAQPEKGLSKPQMVAASGLCVAATAMANLSYGVWQDWWWAAIIFTGAGVVFIKRTN